MQSVRQRSRPCSCRDCDCRRWRMQLRLRPASFNARTLRRSGAAGTNWIHVTVVPAGGVRVHEPTGVQVCVGDETVWVGHQRRQRELFLLNSAKPDVHELYATACTDASRSPPSSSFNQTDYTPRAACCPPARSRTIPRLPPSPSVFRYRSDPPPHRTPPPMHDAATGRLQSRRNATHRGRCVLNQNQNLLECPGHCCSCTRTN